MSVSAHSRYDVILESLGRSAARAGVQSAFDAHRLLSKGIEGAAIRQLRRTMIFPPRT
jgi:Mg2+/Co2+ transporter CorC